MAKVNTREEAFELASMIFQNDLKQLPILENNTSLFEKAAAHSKLLNLPETMVPHFLEGYLTAASNIMPQV